MGVFTVGGSAELYYDNSKKFETTGTGVTITGGLSKLLVFLLSLVILS